MALNTATAAAALVTKLQGLSGLSAVQIGAPESVGVKVSAYVTMGSKQTVRKTTGTIQSEQRLFVMFAYRVDNNESTAETTLMGLVDTFLVALYADLTLGDTVHDMTIDTGAADEPDYQLRAGKEYREYPVIVTVTQRDSYTVNP